MSTQDLRDARKTNKSPKVKRPRRRDRQAKVEIPLAPLTNKPRTINGIGDAVEEVLRRKLGIFFPGCGPCKATKTKLNRMTPEEVLADLDGFAYSMKANASRIRWVKLLAAFTTHQQFKQLITEGVTLYREQHTASKGS